ncbi:MAG: hypothetical protein K2K69_06355 [Muribaculaceae bacterium]|nr:hypothetical protein [Muribaculaceae bacterium]
MKRAAIIATLAIALSLAGCRGHRAATLRDSATACVDTTRTTLDTIGHRSETTGTSATMSAITSRATVRFVGGSGGTVSIDSAGRITLGGVDSIEASLTATHATDSSTTTSTEDAAVHREQATGISHHTEQREQPSAPAPKWYDTAFRRIGQGVLLAAILWLLFLYLHRRK